MAGSPFDQAEANAQALTQQQTAVQEAQPAAPVAPPATTNGHVEPVAEKTYAIRRLPVYYDTIELDGEYAGWTARVRTNPPYSVIEMLSDPMQVYDAFPKIIDSHNFVDEEGEGIGDDFKKMPVDLGLAVISAWNDVRKLPNQNAG